MNKIIVSALVGAGLLAGGAAHAAQGRGAGQLMKADANQDGVITRDEMLAAERTRFAALDTDKDGKLSAAERQEAGGRRGGRVASAMLGRSDTDGDGFVTRAEAEAAAGKRFGMLDGNGDGRIDAAERNAAMEKMRAMRGFGGR